MVCLAFLFYFIITLKMKRLEELYNRVVEATLEASGLSFEQLAMCRADKCVTARVVMVDRLIRLGMTEGEIVELSGMSQQRVNSLKNSAKYRLKGLSGRLMAEDVERMTE